MSGMIQPWPPSAGSVIGSMVFVGRKREMSDLRAALDGSSRIVLVAGDAGVGMARPGVRQGLLPVDRAV
jgi:hypothetical protein